MTNTMNETKPAGAASAVEHLVRDAARDEWYEGINDGKPYHWRDVGPDEIWAAAWDAATKAEREACAEVCEEVANAPRTTKSGALAARDCMGFIRMRSSE